MKKIKVVVSVALVVLVLLVTVNLILQRKSSDASTTVAQPTQQYSAAGKTSGSGTPLPAPQKTVDMNSYLTPIAAGPTATPVAPTYPEPPLATKLSDVSINVDSASPASPIVWAVQSSSAVTLVLGYLRTEPSPAISEIHPIARWEGQFKLLSMKLSPDKVSLAILLLQDTQLENSPKWLYTVNLVSNEASPVPSPAIGAKMPNLVGTINPSLIGWVDNNLLAIQTDSDVLIAKKDGSVIRGCLLFAAPNCSGPIQSALSPDGSKLFSRVIRGAQDSGYWVYNINDASVKQQIVSQADALPLYSPSWSPNDQYISFISPLRPDFGELSLVLLNRATNVQTKVSVNGTWDTAPVWSADGRSLAFLRADIRPSPASSGQFEQPEQVSTNVYILDPATLAVRKLTSFSGVRNGGMQWSADSRYLIITSTAGSPSDALGLAAVSTADGKVTPLISDNSNSKLAGFSLAK